MAEQLTAQELQTIINAATKLGLDINTLHAANPFDAEYSKTNTGQALRMQITESDPVMAAQLQSKGGFKQSLAVAAYNAGVITEKTAGIHQQLMESDPAYVKMFNANQAAEEERLLALMQSEADKAYEARTGNDAADRDRPNFAHLGKMASAAEAQWIHRKLMAD